MISAACEASSQHMCQVSGSRNEVMAYLLSNAEDGGHDMRSREQWDNTGVHDTKVGSAINLQVGTDNTALLAGAQLAAASGVVQRAGVLADEGLDVSVAGDVGAGEDLEGLQLLDGRGVADDAGVLDGLDEELQVGRVGELAGALDGEVEDAAADGLDVAAGEGVLQADDEHARVPDQLQDRGLVGRQLLGQDGLLLLVAGDDLGRGVGGEVLRAVLGGGRGGDLSRGVGVGVEGKEEEEVAGRGGVWACALLAVLGHGLGGEGGVAGEVGRGDLVGGHGSDGRQEDVVLEVVAHGGEVDDGLDTDLAVQRTVADSGNLEDLGGEEWARCHDGLLVYSDRGLSGVGRCGVLW